MVFVCAGGNPAIFDDRPVFAWLRRLARQGVAIGGISGGPYVLAKAGLLTAPRHAALGASARLPRGVSRRRRGAVAVRDRRQPHHLLGRHLGARHDGGADRARSRPPARRRRRRLVPPHPYPRGLRPPAHGSPLPARRRRREAARRAARHGESLETPQPRAALARAGRHLAPAARAAVPSPYRPRHPRPLSLAAAGARAPAPARDDAAGARRGARHRLRLGEPVRPRLSPRLRRAAEPHPRFRCARQQ